MGMQYQTFFLLYSLAMAAFGAWSQANRRASSTLYGTVLWQDGIGVPMRILSVLGQIAFPALLVIGFLLLKWYLVVAAFLGGGSLAGILYTLLTVRPNRDPGVLHHVAAGLFGSVVAVVTLYLWAQYLL